MSNLWAQGPHSNWPGRLTVYFGRMLFFPFSFFLSFERIMMFQEFATVFAGTSFTARHLNNGERKRNDVFEAHACNFTFLSFPLSLSPPLVSIFSFLWHNLILFSVCGRSYKSHIVSPRSQTGTGHTSPNFSSFLSSSLAPQTTIRLGSDTSTRM